MTKRQTFNSFEALELILQPGSDDALEVDHYESSNKNVEDKDFAEDVPKIDGNPGYETSEDGKLNQRQWWRWRKLFCLHFAKLPRHVNNALTSKKPSVKKRKP